MQLVKRLKKDFANPQSISRHLYCSICHQVFDDPVRTICGHTFCYLCIQNWANVTKKCPICKEGIQKRKLEKDFIASSIIDDLRVNCNHIGCTWIGDHSIFKKHIRQCPCRPQKKFIKTDFIESIDLELVSDSDIVIQQQHSIIIN